MKSIKPLEVDVTPLLQRGEEPFSFIICAVDELETGQSLLLKAPFDPVPLYAILATKGLTAQTTETETGFEILFSPTENAPSDDLTLDLRDLEPPEPMQRTLEQVSRLGRHNVLTILTRNRPVFLVEQLTQSDFETESEEHSADTWSTQIWRKIR